MILKFIMRLGNFFLSYFALLLKTKFNKYLMNHENNEELHPYHHLLNLSVHSNDYVGKDCQLYLHLRYF